MADFSDYELSSKDFSVYALADGMLPEIATAAQFTLTPEPDAENIGSLIGKVGPDKELQQNIGAVREALGPDAKDQIADWIEKSGILFPVERGFADPTSLPEETDAIVWGGGVANWILRRAALTQRFDPDKVGRVVLPFGNRVMKPTEHQLVKTFAKEKGRPPKEYEFGRAYVLGSLMTAGFTPKPKIIPVGDGNGDRVLDALFEREPQLLDGTITVMGNAPNTIQAAGQLRLAARRADPGFDSTGEQLFMASDSVPVARRGEAAKTHQNPETALGQLVRNALFLEKNRS